MDPVYVTVLRFLNCGSLSTKHWCLVFLLLEFAINCVKLPNPHRPLLNEGREEAEARLTFG